VKALILGGTGTIGSVIANKLLSNGWDIDIASRGISKVMTSSNKIKHIKIDRHDHIKFYDTFKDKNYDVVIDLVAFTIEDIKSIKRCFKGKIKQYVFFSSFQVYSFFQKGLLLKEDFVDKKYIENKIKEFDLLSASKNEIYAIEKMKCEYMIMTELYQENAFYYTIIRPSKVYSENDKHGHFNWYISRIKNGFSIVISDEHIMENFLVRCVYNDDIADLCSQILLNEKAFNKTYNVAQSEILTFTSFLVKISEILGKNWI